MICAWMSSRKSLWYTPFTEPTVPTGMKMGVSMVPWSVVIRPRRALVIGSVESTSNFML